MSTKNKSAGSQCTPRGFTQGNVLVCHKTGLPIDCVVDSAGIQRLAVDANITAQNIQVEVDLDFYDDGVHIGDPISGNVLVINPDGSIDANVEVDAADGDNIAISGHPDPIFDEQYTVIPSMAPVVVFTHVSTNNGTRIVRVDATASTPATFSLKINGVIKKVLRSGPFERNVVFKFDEHRPLLSSETLTVEALVDRFITPSCGPGNHNSFVSLEGYLT